MTQLTFESPNEPKIEARASDLIAMADRAYCNSDADLEKCADLIKMIKTTSKKVEDERKALVKPFNDGVKAINTRFKGYVAPLNEAEGKVKNIALAYQQEKQRKQEEERRRIAAEEEAKRLAEAQAAEEAGKTEEAEKILDKAVEAEAQVNTQVQQAPAPVRGDFGGSLSVRKTWTYEITDLAKVPREFLIVDQKAVKDAIKSGARDIPGLNIYQEETMVSR